VIDDKRGWREQVDVHIGQSVGRLAAHHIGDESAQVTTLRHIAGVTEPDHELRPGESNATGLPTGIGRLARESVARQGRQHQMKCVVGVATVRGNSCCAGIDVRPNFLPGHLRN
jgi:hypothetical protein